MKLTGKIVHITFYDHSCFKEIITCEAFGRVVRDSKLQIRIACWDLKTSDGELRRSNWETYSILKSAIIEIKELFSI